MLLSTKQLISQAFSVTFLVGLLLGCVISVGWRGTAFPDPKGVFSSGIAGSLHVGGGGTGGTSKIPDGDSWEEGLAKAREEAVRKTSEEVAALRWDLLKVTTELQEARQTALSAVTGVNASLDVARQESAGLIANLTAELQRAKASAQTVGALSQSATSGAILLAKSQCNATRFRHLAGGMIVEGPCVCLGGTLCSLNVFSNNASHWDTEIKIAQELIVYFVGPARAIANLQVEHLSSAKAAWTATFRIWDAGEYRALVQGGCTSNGLIETLADFTITIIEAEEKGSLTPCSYGQGYRWLLNRTSKQYEWTNYPCAPALIPASDYAFLVRKKGFRRVIFVGDSQQRALYQHLKYLLGAPVKEEELNRPKKDLSDVVNAGDPERELHLLFYWIDGIYENGEFGCINRGMFSGRNESTSYPEIATGADIISLEAGTWTSAWCAEAWQAFNKHLPDFLNWGETLLNPQSRLVWRTAPSYMTECRRKHVKLQYVNRVALDAVSSRPYLPFSSWDVEAPRFADFEQMHYSWTTVNKTTKEFAMAGPVGEAVAKAFMTWTIYTLQ